MNKKAILIDEITTVQGLKIQIWDSDFQHALDGHPEVTIDRVRESLKNPVKVVQSKKNNCSCLFYSLEVESHPEFGEIYFCVVVRVIGQGSGKMETAYETNYMKSGNILYEKNPTTGRKK